MRILDPVTSCGERLTVLGIVALGAVLGASGLAAEPAKLALLVGCTKYPYHPGLRELYGPGNDVPTWAALLTDPQGLAFPRKQVTQLVGWPKRPEGRPTYANIVKGFEGLIAQAQPDSRIVILLSGHGLQVPIPDSQKDPLDPKNPEPDGLDEVFLPADVKDWTESGLEHAILDDQIGAWLDRLRDRGAHVLIVFDCCHSGGMTRSGPDVREINRTASPAALKIPDQAYETASARARQAVAEAKAAGRPVPGELKVKAQEKPGRGSLVAFYAAQPFEEAPELPFPEGAAIVPSNYYGMLSWTLIQTIKARHSPLSYAELQRLVAAGYRAARGTRPPTPFAEGDLNREVLGLNVWPSRTTLYVERDKKGQLRFPAGSLHGLTQGSIVAIHPPPNDARNEQTVLGYLAVESLTASTAIVVPTKLDPNANEAAIAAENVPDMARCEVVRRAFGDLGVKLFATAGGVNSKDPGRKASSQKRAAAVKLILDKLQPEVKELVRLVAGEPDADWVLQGITPEEAKQEYRIDGLTEDQIFLVHGEGRVRLADERPAPTRARQPRKVFGRYPLANEPALLGALERDLPKIYRWENLWRVANEVHAVDGGESYGLVVEVLKLKDEHDRQGEELRAGVLKSGDEVAFWVTNGGPHNLWVTAFYLDANLRIRVVFSDGVGRGKRVKLGQGSMTVDDNSAGLEGLVAFAIPQAVQKDQPTFAMLEQEPLQVVNAARRGVDRGRSAPLGSFERLLDHAAFHSEMRTRSWEPRVSTAPAILTRSWVLVP